MGSDGRDLVGELERLSSLREQGHLTEAGFAAAKQQLLAGGSAPRSRCSRPRPRSTHKQRPLGSGAAPKLVNDDEEVRFDLAKILAASGPGAPNTEVSEEAYEYHTVTARTMRGLVVHPPGSTMLDEVRNQMAQAGWQYVREHAVGPFGNGAVEVLFRRIGRPGAEPPPLTLVERYLQTPRHLGNCWGLATLASLLIGAVVGIVAVVASARWRRAG